MMAAGTYQNESIPGRLSRILTGDTLNETQFPLSQIENAVVSRMLSIKDGH